MAMNKKINIINFDELDKPIMAIEKIMSSYNQEENALIIKLITQRFNNRNSETRASEVTTNVLKKMPFGKMLFRGQED